MINEKSKDRTDTFPDNGIVVISANSQWTHGEYL